MIVVVLFRMSLNSVLLGVFICFFRLRLNFGLFLMLWCIGITFGLSLKFGAIWWLILCLSLFVVCWVC